MANIYTNISIDVITDEDYSYNVLADNDAGMCIRYFEEKSLKAYVSFGSKEEMLAVARAMIKACEMSEICI
jgi:hypothetical protein